LIFFPVFRILDSAIFQICACRLHFRVI
jgi:hypothetical protein